MQIRILAGCQGLVLVLACASLSVSPSSAAEPVLYERSNYVWPFASGPVYGAVEAARWNSAGVLHTQVGSFDLTRGWPDVPNELRAANRLGTVASQYFLLQVRPEAFANGSFDGVKGLITDQGGSIVNEMPVAAFVVRLTPGAFNAIKESPSVIALQPYQPAFKLSPEIGRIPLLDAVKATSSVYTLRLRLFPGEDPRVVAASLTAMGLTVKGTYGDMVFVDADRSKLAAIAALDPVASVEEVLPIFLMSEETSTTVQTGRWNSGATPYTDAGVDGGGSDKDSQADDQILMILDNGIQLDAGDLSNTRTDAGLDFNGLPIAGHRKVAFYGTTNPFGGSGDLLGCDGSTTSGVTHGHTVAAVALGNATKVPPTYGAGWNAVDSSGNFWGLDGVAPKARLVAYDGQVTPQTGSCGDVTQMPSPIVGITPLDPGDLYTAPATGSLPDGYAKGARVVNFSWGSIANVYDTNAQKIDNYLVATSDAMIFVAAGNAGRDKNGDGIPDSNTIGAPATAKNIIAVGASGNADDQGNPNLPNSRWENSSNGPATVLSGRIAPLLMAPGTDAGTLGLASEYHCRSNDNDQYNAVECDVIAGQVSTSYASAATAGAGLLVRDYFAQGFYPDGTNSNVANNVDKVPTISGALLKAVLVTSAEWMHAANSNLPYGPNLTRRFRGNREQGYGRIQLTNALPLQSYPGAVSGLIVGDGGPAPAGLVNDTALNLNLAPSSSTSATINVCDTSQPLTVAIAWMDPGAGDTISRDLDLELTSPTGRKYLGNFFTDDVNGNTVIDGSEDCTYVALPWPVDSAANTVDTGPWSLPVSGTGVSCVSATAHVDHNNDVEAIFLSPDSRLNGVADNPATVLNEATDNQIEQGAWTVTVKSAATNSGPQPYSITIAGGVCNGSAARIRRVLPSNQLDEAALTCNDSAVVTIDEIATGGDPNPTAAQVASRTKVEVVDANDAVVDTETFTAPDFAQVTSSGSNYRFDSRKILLTDGTAPEPGNGVLDVRDGQTIRVTYQDVSVDPTPDPNAKRVASAPVNCRPLLASGDVVFALFGKDASTLISGGCEKDANGYFTFGFPDRYMDAGELLSYTVAIRSGETATDLRNVNVSLKAVMADANSPADCKPGSTPTAACPDPNRTDNPSCPYLTVLDSPKVYGLWPAGTTITPSFTIQMQAAIPGTQKVDMIIGATSRTAGKGADSLIANREVLNADEVSLFYSTDFPAGGVEPVGGYDVNNNEILEALTTDPHNPARDHVFETRAYSDMTATNPLAAIKAPWNFDTNNGGFTSGLQNTSHPSAGTYSQWGEDENYNGRLDGFCTGDTTIPCTQGVPTSVGCFRCSLNKGRACSADADCQSPLPNEGTCQPKGTCDFTLGEDRNPVNGVLDQAWSTAGGCGWQTKSPGDPTGGVWHTGLIGTPGQVYCLASGNDPADCQRYWATPDGDLVGDNNWWELLLTPVLHKVNQGLDGSGDPIYRVEITDWAWNMSIDIPDANTSVTLEFDTDVSKSAGVELFNDTAVLASLGGRFGAISGSRGDTTGGFSMFARVSKCEDTDGNGSLDRCGTAAGPLCNANKLAPDNECTGFDLPATRGTCSLPPTQRKCTGNPNLNCTTDAQCNQRCSLDNSRSCQSPAQSGSTSTSCTTPLPSAGVCQDNVAVLGLASPGEKCVDNVTACDTANDICPGLGQGVCVAQGATNREGNNNCAFEGTTFIPAGQAAIAQEPYGLAGPPDDDAANGYCNRNDGLNGIDKSVSCTSPLHCDAAGGAYASVRACSLRTSVICTANANCGACSLNNAHACTTTSECLTGEGTCTAAALGTCTTHLYDATCTKADGGVDEFVQRNGPGRNFGIRVLGPDMQLTQLEDLYGDTGTAFQAALGFNNKEPNSNTSGIQPGFGVAVDDMVISWKETRLDEDTHDCASSGECATVESSSTVSYEGNAVLSLTVTDKSPYDAVNTKNDCNGNGVYTDPDDDQDCNNNGKLDVTVRLTSDAEPTGEIAVLDQLSPGSPVYKGSFPYSASYNSPGTIFVAQSGSYLPEVRVTYDDRNDGTGSRCKNALDPAMQGLVTSTTTVAVTTGRIVVASYYVKRVSTCTGAPAQQCVVDADCAGFGTCSTAYGDDDGFADTNELCNLVVVFGNKSGVDVDDLSATLGTDSPNIECITRSSILVGPLADKLLSNPATYLPFQFKVANVNRTSVDQVLQAKFTITVRSNKFDALTRATDIALNLDLNATGGVANPNNLPYEDFEAGFGKFTLESLDAGKTSVAKSDRFRCQYNDPFGLNTQSYGNKDCFLGFTSDSTGGVNDWHVHSSTASTMGVGRAFTGKQSLHMGVHTLNGGPAYDTTRLKHIMSVRTVNPIFLGLAGANPELNFAQQVSFVDNSSGFDVTQGEAPDRGIVEVQLATAAGAASGSWIKIYPYANVYDQQGTDDFSSCLFDPTDDGNNEDSFFDPADPSRRLGPSSTCYPEFVFVRQGQTDHTKTFDVNDIGNASDGPGLQGCSSPTTAGCLPANTPTTISNPGTWVRPRFSLIPFAGRPIRVRFLFSSFDFDGRGTWLDWFGRDVPYDDGWYIDDIRLDGTLTAAMSLSPDAATIASPLACGTCSAVTPALTATPSGLAAPGQIVTLSAASSSIDACPSGVAQFQFWKNGDGNGTVGDAGDTLLRDWTDNATFIDAPSLTTQYGVKVRCSTDTGCDAATNSAILPVTVNCPTLGPFTQSITLAKVPGQPGPEPHPSVAVNWAAAESVDAVRGSLSGTPLAPATQVLKRSPVANSSFKDTVNLCLATNSAPTTSLAEADDPGAGNGFYYLVRGQQTKYTTGAPKERGVAALCNSPRPRDAELATDPVPCP